MIRSTAGLIAVQLLDGVANAIFVVVAVLVVADRTRGTGRFNLTQGALATAVGLGAASSTLFGGKLIQYYSFRVSFLALGAVATVALALLLLGVPETLPEPALPQYSLPATGETHSMISPGPLLLSADRRRQHFAHADPCPGDPEVYWVGAGSLLLLAFRLIPLKLAGHAVGKGLDVYLFLFGMMLLSELAKEHGVFDWLSAVAVRGAHGSCSGSSPWFTGSGPWLRSSCPTMQRPWC